MVSGCVIVLQLLTNVLLASQNKHWGNTLTTVTDNGMTVACHCATVPVNSMTVSGNHTKVDGYHTTITGEPATKHSPCLQISAHVCSPM